MPKKGKIVKIKLPKRHKKIKKGLAKYFHNYVSNTLLSRRTKCPMPDVFRTTLFIQWEAYGAVGATNVDQYDIWANSAYLPFATTGYAIGATSLSAPSGTALDEATAVSVKNPGGLSRLFSATVGSGMYQSMHVLNSSIRVTYTSAALLDSLNLCIAPQKQSDSTPFSKMGIMEQAPHAKSAVITTSVPKMSVYNHLHIPTYLGLNEQAYLSDNAYSTVIDNGTVVQPSTSVQNGDQVFWTVRRAFINGTTSSALLPYKIMLSYDVVFQSLVGQDLPSS